MSPARCLTFEMSKGSGLRRSRAVALRIVDPFLQCGARPSGSSAAQMNRGRKSAFCDTSIDRRAAEGCDSHHVAQTIEGRRGLGRCRSWKWFVEKHDGSLSSDFARMRLKEAQTNPRWRSAGWWIQTGVFYLPMRGVSFNCPHGIAIAKWCVAFKIENAHQKVGHSELSSVQGGDLHRQVPWLIGKALHLINMASIFPRQTNKPPFSMARRSKGHTSTSVGFCRT